MLKSVDDNTNCPELLKDNVFRNIKNAERFAIDIGGSLVKLAYYSTVKISDPIDQAATHLQGEAHPKLQISGQLNFVKFELKHIESCLNYIRDTIKSSCDATGEKKVVSGTGGGIYKYWDLITSKLNLTVQKADEIDCLVKGCVFVLRNIPDEAFVYDHTLSPQYRFQGVDQMTFPFLLVNIGSGVSFIKVVSENIYERVGGTANGGGTFWGLGSLLTKAKTFHEILDLAAAGDHRNVDMLVGDINNSTEPYSGLHKDVIASSFGKAARSTSEGQEFERADLARSLLLSICNDISQIAYLYAKLHQLSNIYFGGFFIRGHPITMRAITYSVSFWSNSTIKALFLRHEGYLGAIGAFLQNHEDNEESYSWGENYVGSSGLQSPKAHDSLSSKTFDTLEFSRHTRRLVPCEQLLDSHSYFPDTVDLTQNEEQRSYWLQCFIDGSDRNRQQAISSQLNCPDCEERARMYQKKYVSRLEGLKVNPSAFGSLTVRSLLDLNNHCLQEFLFHDIFLEQKSRENNIALKQLPHLLVSLGKLEWSARQMALALGLLAGNVFDWGAKEIVDIMTTDDDFNFEAAKNKLQTRPWLVDDYDEWTRRLSKRPRHKCAAIFCDNSGADIVLGVLPFALELLKSDCQVILCANSGPALNDVTFSELQSLMSHVREIAPEFVRYLDQGRLSLAETGQSSPCLDLRLLDEETVKLMSSKGTDLVIIEGMGRAIHTNFYASFVCETLRVAVLKNKMVARWFNGETFNIIFKYERANMIIADSSR